MLKIFCKKKSGSGAAAGGGASSPPRRLPAAAPVPGGADPEPASRCRRGSGAAGERRRCPPPRCSPPSAPPPPLAEPAAAPLPSVRSAVAARGPRRRCSRSPPSCRSPWLCGAVGPSRLARRQGWHAALGARLEKPGTAPRRLRPAVPLHLAASSPPLPSRAALLRRCRSVQQASALDLRGKNGREKRKGKSAIER